MSARVRSARRAVIPSGCAWPHCWVMKHLHPLPPTTDPTTANDAARRVRIDILVRLLPMWPAEIADVSLSGASVSSRGSRARCEKSGAEARLDIGLMIWRVTRSWAPCGGKRARRSSSLCGAASSRAGSTSRNQPLTREIYDSRRVPKPIFLARSERARA